MTPHARGTTERSRSLRSSSTVDMVGATHLAFYWTGGRASRTGSRPRRAGAALRRARCDSLTGWGFETFESLVRIELWSIVGNEASDAVARRAGFVEEGVLRSRLPTAASTGTCAASRSSAATRASDEGRCPGADAVASSAALGSPRERRGRSGKQALGRSRRVGAPRGRNRRRRGARRDVRRLRDRRPADRPRGRRLRPAPRARSGAVALDCFFAVPSRASEDMEEVVIDFGDASTQVFHIGEASVAVPGLLAGLEEAHARRGRLPWQQLFVPALELARRGRRARPGPGVPPRDPRPDPSARGGRPQHLRHSGTDRRS